MCRKELIFSFLISLSLIGHCANQLVQKADMPTARYFSYALNYKDKIYVFGGDNTGAVEVYSPATDTWEIKKSFPGSEMNWSGVGILEDTVYAVIGIGSRDHTKYQLIAAYSILNNTWTRIDSTHSAINDPGVVLHKRSLYIIGGFMFSGTTPLNVDSVKEFNIDSKKWSVKAKLPQKRHTPQAVSTGSEIYLFGGVADNFGYPPSKSVQVYNPKTNSWSSKKDGNLPLAYFRASENTDQIYFAFENTITVYDATKDLWKIDNSVNSGLDWFSHAFYKNVLYMFGGKLYNGEAKSNKVYAYTPASMVTDIDGNVYRTVNIGNKTWFQENLKTTKYNDGTDIALTTDNTEWKNLTSGGFCWYKNDAGYKESYGALYNWHSVNSGKLCPGGWHVPSDNEWKLLIDELGGLGIAGGKLKITDTIYWQTPNTEATNSTRFSAIAGGCRDEASYFWVLRKYGYYWTATDDPMGPWYYYMGFDNSEVKRRNDPNGKVYGYSVRCISDMSTNNVAQATAEQKYVQLKYTGNPYILNFSLNIPQESFYRLAIVDIKGNIIEILVNKQLGSGIHNIQWNNKNLPAGVYFYQLSSKSYLETGKILMNK